MKKLYINIKELFNYLNRDNIGELAAGCAYYTILSFIPFLILLLTMIQYTGIEQQTIFDILSKIIPVGMNELVIGIIREVYSKSIGTISVSILVTLWSAGKGLYALSKGMKILYNMKEEIKANYVYLRIKAIIQTIIFIFLIVIGLTLLVFGNSLIAIIEIYLGTVKHFNIITAILTEIIFIFATFGIFLLIYKFMPKHKVTFKSQIYGAIFGAIALNIISLIFSRFLDIFKGFSITYGSLTTLMLIMMWTYSCFYIVFLGAEINKFKQEKIKAK